MRHISPQLCAQLSFISLSLVIVSTSYGQSPSLLSRVPPRIPSREQALSDLRVERAERDFEREKRILMVSVKEDFRQMQIVELDLMRRIFEPANNAEPMSSKEIRTSLGEIRNRAERLKSNFRLPEVSSDKHSNDDACQYETLSEGLLLLDKSVTKFVENPIFQQLQVLDAQLSIQAAQDLDKILLLTDSLRRTTKQKSLRR